MGISTFFQKSALVHRAACILSPLTSLAILMTLSSCAVVDPKGSFDHVAMMVQEKTGQKIQWDQFAPVDGEVGKHIDRLLDAELSLDQAIEISLLKNPKLQSYYEDLGVAQADLVQAGLLKNPAFMIERRFSGKALELDLAQSFIELLMMPLKKRFSAAVLEAVKFETTARIVDHIADVKRAYYELQESMQMLEMRDSIVAAAEGAVDMAQRLNQAGNIIVTPLKIEQVALSEAQLDRIQARADVEVHHEQLRSVLGISGEGRQLRLPGRLSPVPDQLPEEGSVERRLLADRADLAAERIKIDAVAASRGIEGLGKILDELTLTVHSEREPSGDRSFGPSFSLSLPIFDQGSAQYARGDALLRQAIKEYEAHVIAARAESRAVLAQLRGAQQSAMLLLNETLPLRHQIVEQTQLQYNVMGASVFELLQARRAEIEAGERYVKAVAEYWTSHAMLERSAGGSLAGLTLRRVSQHKITTPPAPAARNIDSKEMHQHHHHKQEGK